MSPVTPRLPRAQRKQPKREQQRGQQSTEPTFFSSKLHPQTCWFRELTAIFPFQIMTEEVMPLYVASISLAFKCFIENNSNSKKLPQNRGWLLFKMHFNQKKRTQKRNLTPTPFLTVAETIAVYFYQKPYRSVLQSALQLLFCCSPCRTN